jgi:hypothetical protein
MMKMNKKMLLFLFCSFSFCFAFGQSKQDTLFVWIDANDIIYLYSALKDEPMYKVSVDSNYFEQTLVYLKVDKRSPVQFYAELAADARVVTMIAEDIHRIGYMPFEVQAIEPAHPFRSELASIAQAAVFPSFIQRPVSSGLTIVLIAQHQYAYYLAEEYPRIRIQTLTGTQLNELLQPLKETPVTLKIDSKAHPDDAKTLIRALDELEIFNYQFGEIHAEERNIIQQLLR